MDTTALTSNPTLTAVGTATEFIAGEPKTTVCYGTFAGDLGNAPFRFRISFVEHTGAFQMHSHEYAELALVLSGTAVHLTDVENHALEAGDVIVINGGRHHGFERAQGLRLCNIMFDPEQFFRDERELEALMGYHALFKLAPRATEPGSFRERMHLTTDELAHVNTLLMTLKNESETRTDGWMASVRYTFLGLVTFLARAYGQHKREHATPLLQMARAVSHIQQNYHTTIGIVELARLAHLSPSQFQRRFKQIYNVTPIQFVTQVRLHAARELLKDPNKDITSVALATGFASSAFFSVQFKRHTGESPSAYRKRQLSNDAADSAAALNAVSNPA